MQIVNATIQAPLAREHFFSNKSRTLRRWKNFRHVGAENVGRNARSHTDDVDVSLAKMASNKRLAEIAMKSNCSNHPDGAPGEEGLRI